MGYPEGRPLGSAPMVLTSQKCHSLPLDDKIYDATTLYTIGFLVDSKDSEGREALVPSGSGVLANIGGVRGIITAAHVVRNLEKSKRIALFTIVNTRQKARSLQFSPSEMMFAVDESERRSEGPDLAFVQVPQRIEEHLSAENAFYNFEIRFRDSSKSSPNQVAHLLSGVLAERSELKEFGNSTRVDTHTMVHGGGVVSNERNTTSGHDLFDFDFAHNADVRRPETYGGLSGAAIWRTFSNEGRDERIVFGVAFYESDADANGRRTITCHGPRSVYVKLVDLVRKQFGKQYKEII